MQKIVPAAAARTTADLVYDALRDEIDSLKLLPGAKISEAEVAGRLGVSRQPVRDAFNRLGNAGLLLVRPQRATEVRRFSLDHIENNRFIRRAVELEVIATASAVWDSRRAEVLERNLVDQRESLSAGLTEQFHALDYDFHRLICELSGLPLAFETIATCKRTVDRLCRLSFGRSDEVTAILAEHEEIAGALRRGSAAEALAATQVHMKRLDGTIAEVFESHSGFFD